MNPAALDADPNVPLLARLLSPPKKKKASTKPQIVRKKLHWVPIKGKVEGTIWAGPPGDLIAAAAKLIDNEAEFERLFIQVRVGRSNCGPPLRRRTHAPAPPHPSSHRRSRKT